jgi:hypothetical protein
MGQYLATGLVHGMSASREDTRKKKFKHKTI